MQLDTILQEITEKGITYLDTLGNSLYLKNILIFKFDKNIPYSADLVYSWLEGSEHGKDQPRRFYHFADNLRPLIDKINKRIPLKGTFEEYGKTISFIALSEYKTFCMNPIQIDEELWGFSVCVDAKKDRTWTLDELEVIMDLSGKAAEVFSEVINLDSLAKRDVVCNTFLEDIADITLQMDQNLKIKSYSGFMIRSGDIKAETMAGKSFKGIFNYRNRREERKMDSNIDILVLKRHSFTAYMMISDIERWVYVQTNIVNAGESAEIFCAITILSNIRPINEMKERADLYESLMKNSNTMYIVWDKSLNPVFVSEPFSLMTGYSDSEIWDLMKNPEAKDRGKTMMSLQDIKRLRDIISDAFNRQEETDMPGRTELILSNRAGAKEFVAMTIRQERDQDGYVQKVITEMYRDTNTEAVRNAKALLKNKWGSLTLDPTCVFFLNQEGIITYMNPSMISLFRENISGRSAKEIIDRTRHSDFMREMSSLSKNKVYTNVMNMPFVILDVKHHVSMIATRLFQEGEQKGYICVFREKKYSKNNEPNEEQKNIMNEMTNEFVLMSNLDLRYTYISPSIVHFLGYSLDEIYQMEEGGELLADISYPKIAKVLERGLSSIEQRNFLWHENVELVYISKKGKKVGTKSDFRIYVDEKGKAKGFVCLSRVEQARRKH